MRHAVRPIGVLALALVFVACGSEAAPSPSAELTAEPTLGSPPVPVHSVTLGGDPFFRPAFAPEIFISLGGDPAPCDCNLDCVDPDSAITVDPATVVDGRFLDLSCFWNVVWWQTPELSGLSDYWIQIDLDGVYRLDEAIVQADCGDTYLLSYRDLETGAWLPLWMIPRNPGTVGCIRQQALATPVATDAVRFEEFFGDGRYAVSEIQLFGRPAKN